MSSLHLLKLGAISLLSLAGLAAQNVITTVPRLIRVEGSIHLSDSSTSGVEGVTLSIYATQSGGTALWQENQNVTFGRDGRYSILLGATRNEGMPADLFVSGEERWLGVQFQRSGEPEQPRTLLASVPYALKAASADTLGGLPASAFLLNPSYPAATTSSEARAAVPMPRITSSGTANSLARFVDNAGDLANSVLYQSGTKVGLATTNPLDYFHVAFTDTTGSLTGYAVQNLASGANAYPGMLFYDQTGALGQFQGFNNSTHEYRINNIAKTNGTVDGSINFMIGSQSAFKIRPDLDVDIPNIIRKNGAIFINTIGAQNTSVGLNAGAGPNHAFGDDFNNTAFGFGADSGEQSGNNNTAIGTQALYSNTSGVRNTAIGSNVLFKFTGLAHDGTLLTDNTGVGFEALYGLTSGKYNTALGSTAGMNITTGSNNILIGNTGTSSDDSTIRIGTQGTQTTTYIAGISGVNVGGAVAVYIDPNGQLGTIQSSRRYKEDVQDMNDASDNLYRLRPVTYRYKQSYPDGSKPLDYGLIAEEVAQIYPDLVVRTNDGKIETVQYQKLTPMLLNEVQKQHRHAEQQDRTIQSLKEEMASLRKLAETMAPSATTTSGGGGQ